jgi:serine/threonine protein phosphatase PrpC
MATRLRLISTALSDIGYVRANNQDSGFAGSRLIAMADGMGGHAGGDTASTIVIRSLAHIERSEHRGSVGAMASRLVNSLLAAHDAIIGRAQKEPTLAGMGTTVDAVALTHGWWVQVHIGDSRAYLLRDGHLIRMTKDHSYVQHLIDTGRITPEEGRNHPQKNIVMRVLGDFDIDPHPDVALHKAQPGDRWLLCSDGLCGSLEDQTIQEVMLSEPDRAVCAQKLVNMALRAGSTDNVTAVIGDAQTAPAERWSLINPNYGVQVPLVAGAAVAGISSIADIVHRPVAQAPLLESEQTPAQKAAALSGRAAEHGGTRHDAVPAEDVDSSTTEIAPGQKVAHPADETAQEEEDIPDTGEIPVVRTPDGHLTADPSNAAVRREAERRKEEHQKQVAGQARHRRRVHVAWISSVIGVIVLLTGGFAAYYAWSQQEHYLGVDDGYVAVYQGVSTDLFGISLSHPVRTTNIRISSLPSSWRGQLNDGIPVSSVEAGLRRARDIASQSDAIQSTKPGSSTKDSAKNSGDGAKSDGSSSDGKKQVDASSDGASGSSGTSTGTSSTGKDAR